MEKDMIHASRMQIAIAAAGVLMATFASAVEVRYYPVPKGSHPHDVALAANGSVWYTAQSSGELGLLDQATGKTVQVWDSYPINGRAAAVRQMLGRSGEAWGAESSNDRLVVVREK